MGPITSICFSLTVALISYSRAQMIREITYGDMDQLTSRLKDMGLGMNSTSMQLLGGTVKSIKNLVQYEGQVNIAYKRCVVTVITDADGNTIKTEKRCFDGSGPAEPQNNMVSVIMQLIEQCRALHQQRCHYMCNRDKQDYDATIALLNMMLENYRANGKFNLNDRKILKFNMFCRYRNIIQQLLESIRLEFVTNDQQIYVQNIDFILQIQQLVNLLSKYESSHSGNNQQIIALITRIMNAYYNNEPLDKFKEDLDGIRDDRFIIMPLIKIIINPPPRWSDDQPSVDQTDSFEIALRQLAKELQALKRFQTDNGMYLLKYFNSVLNMYLGNLYVLPGFNDLPTLQNVRFPFVDFSDIITKFLLLVQQQYNKQHNVEDTSKCIRLSEIVDFITKFANLLPDGQQSKEYPMIADLVIRIVWGGGPKKGGSLSRLDRLSQILTILVKLEELRKGGASEEGFSTIFEIIVKILIKVSKDGNITSDIIESNGVDLLDDYRQLIIDLEKILNEFNPDYKKEKEDEFVIKIKILIERLKANRGQSDEVYDRLLIILKRLIADYRKGKILRIYTIEELNFDKVYLKYIDILEEMIKIMELQYIKQGQHNEVTKLIVILQIHKLLMELLTKLPKGNDDLSAIKLILIQIIKDVGDKGQMQKDYIDLILKLQIRNDQLEKLIIELIKVITNMPSNVQPPRFDEDYFIKEIRQLMVLLQKMHDEGKSDQGFVETLTILQFILTAYRNNNNKLPSFSLEELKLHIVFKEYADVVYKLILLLEKKHVDQDENDELVKLIFVSKIRELIVKLEFLGEGNHQVGTNEFNKIKKTLIEIMFALYNQQKLDEKYINIFERWLIEFEKFNVYRNLIKEIIVYLKSCPRHGGGDKKSGAEQMIIVLIIKIKEAHKRGKLDDDYSKLMELLQIVLKMLKERKGQVPSITELRIELDIYLRSGLYNDILIEFIRDLMSAFVARGQMEDVAILVKISNLLNWIVQLQKSHAVVGANTGYEALIEAFIQLINDLSRNGTFTKDYLVIWRVFLEIHVEYKNIILQVIDFLSHNCGTCIVNPPTTTPSPDRSHASGSDHVTVTDKFISQLEIILRELEDDQYNNRKLIEWINLIIELYEKNERYLPRLEFTVIKTILTIEGFDKIIEKLLGIIIDQYTFQRTPELGSKVKYVLQIRLYLVEIVNVRNGRKEQNEIIEILIYIIKRLWNEKKLKEDIIDRLKELQGYQQYRMYYQVIVDITIYLRNLPANKWVAIVDDGFISTTNHVIELLKCLLKSGGPIKVFKNQIKSLEQLQLMYKNHGNTLAVGLKISFGDMYVVTVHFSSAWRQMIEAIMMQFRRQGELDEAKKYEFILQIQWYLKLVVDEVSRVNPNEFKQLVALIQLILKDFNNRNLSRDYSNELFYYLQFSALTDVVSRMIFYLSHWGPSFTWIGGTSQWTTQYQTIQWQLQQYQVQYVLQPYVIQNVNNIWNGNMGCATGCFY